MKIKLLAAVLIWGCVFSFKASAQWQTIFKDSSHYWCTSVYFINNDTGFVGTHFFGFYYGSCFRTLDGGQTWDTTVFNTAIFSIQFINDSVGFLGGQDGSIFRTDDMGITWNWVMGPCCPDLFSLHFFNQDTGFYVVGYGDIMQTVNGGSSWQIIFNQLGTTSYPGRSRMFFTDSLTGYVIQGTIAKTTDRGLNWINLNIPLNFYPCSAYFFDSNKGISVGYDGKVSKTFDGGNSWSFPDSIGPYPLSDVSFVNDSIGYIVGGNDDYNYSNTNGIIYKTIDGGNSWQIMDDNYYDGLLKMHFPSDSVGYAVGMNGIILKITNANSVTSSVQLISPFKNQLTISPNPATDKINISFPATASENITTKIFSITGEVVYEQINKSSAPITKFQIPVFNISNGIYFLSVQTGREVMTRKIVVNH